MKRPSWELKVAIGLGATSIALYLIDFAVCRDWHALWSSALANLAFLPLSVLVVTLIIDRLLSTRERRARLEKLNMLISTFYSHLGNHLLRLLVARDEHSQYLRQRLGAAEAWNALDSRRAKEIHAGHCFELSLRPDDFVELRQFLEQKNDCLVRLLENPNLLEHERFTELLRAIFHLDEELFFREDFHGLPDSDLRHLAADANRCYGLLVREWVHYMLHLKRHYPYLFSLAARTNPLDRDASPVVR